MIQINRLAFSYGERPLFQALTLTLNAQKYALVGANGIGKSTFAKILAGELEADAGHIRASHRVVYFPQFAEPPPQWRHLSGGEWMKKRLDALEAHGPAFVVLDEPTNNLDDEGRQRVRDFVRRHEGGLLLISHDRELLEEVDVTLELSNLGLQVYGGPYSFYERAAAAEGEVQARALAEAKKDHRKKDRDAKIKLERQRKRMRTGAVDAERGGMPKILLGARKRRAQASFGKIDSTESARVAESEEHVAEEWQSTKIEFFQRFDFESIRPPSGQMHFAAEGLNLHLGSQPLWAEPLNFYLRGSERWWVRGPNGAGKSSLLRLMTDGAESWRDSFGLEGKFHARPGRMALLDQSQSLLQDDKSLVDNFSGSDWNESELRNQLALFGLRGDLPRHKVGSFSGGERLKAALARIFLDREPPGVLLLDEPTNNLDLISMRILEEALKAYRGALVLISHDPIFAGRLDCGGELLLQPHPGRRGLRSGEKS